MKKIILILFVILVFLLFSSCADQVNIEAFNPDEESGFFAGLWHGVIILFSLIGSMFSDNIAIYSANNSGFMYYLGFVFGVAILYSSTKD